ncbi:MAG TPA: 3-phosphoserine/phosphohydroxythreonine transaminase [Blastocatellia bacterium]|jgi:phosphoserine aminotransferase|nr:3-phosphoserine/phosphohydroxythreonine transaminase [Blastocatellia bacterium]HCX31839.1 3-phosphoserine/phosphohydroxythreonine transaminase [Blastocatellia bacterium]
MTERIYNFSAGPAILPVPVLEEAQRDMLSLPGVGMSVMEISHRSTTFDEIFHRADAGLRELLGVPDNYHVLFLQGGASLQFSMVPMNFLPAEGSADYILTGSWGKKALKEAKRAGATNVAATMADGGFTRIPGTDELKLDPKAAYVHITTNETIEGVEWKKEPGVGEVPLVVDASSDILSHPIPIDKYALIYAGAQKNMGPSGVTLVILRDDLLQRIPDGLHTMLDYRTHVDNKSLYNTPNTWGIYILSLVCKWLKDKGGLEAMHRENEAKAQLIYDAIDSTDFYRGHADADSRSIMNVTFRLPSEELEKKFTSEATAQGMVGLKGHRSVGGIRASIYNAFPLAGVEVLVAFMKEFEKKIG